MLCKTPCCIVSMTSARSTGCGMNAERGWFIAHGTP